uniref:Uncharacterized protein n=1 Tax=Oryza nivara TaxID=4536 RepID=A0A0E0I896_ORYNI
MRRSDEEEERRIRWRRGAWTGAMLACAASMGDCRREAMRRRIQPLLCAPCARILLRRRGSIMVAGNAFADPAPPSFCVDPAWVKTMGRRRDGGDLRGGELVLRHPWSSGGHPWRRFWTGGSGNMELISIR